MSHTTAGHRTDGNLNEGQNADPFYSESNMNALRESAEQYGQGKTVTRSIEELEALEAECPRGDC